ncbi:hypothetical protein DPMN_118055 [Dreissena polymorpha]|uniref:Zinc-ribbon domain-containing protein n=1 Tax=Dreissena polymorpha TaxID=45954 RepID=A0A9D4GJG7_DREPO|nr:hypothetical protein DPMN_118055 [Dreissena polymorpha]
MFCKKCGEAVDDDANYCAKCGTPVNRSSTASVTSTSKKQDEEIEKDETFVGKGGMSANVYNRKT